MPVIEAVELYRFFHAGEEEIKALRGVSLHLERGELFALMGPSGSGKSTLLHCLSGLDEPDGGMVRVNAHPMSRQSEAARGRLRAAYIGLMLQKNNLFEHLTIAENMVFAQEANGDDYSYLAYNFLEELGIADRVGFLPRHLSGGERARASLAVALATNPQILLLDEPTSEVDRGTEDRIISMLQRLCEAGKSIVVATHNPALSAAADRIVSLRDGKISYDD